MLEELNRRILKMDLKRPYVWQLRISAAEFAELEEAVRDGSANALGKVVYLAEWYRRCYDGAGAKPVREFDSQELEEIFVSSGINQAGNLFRMENGNRSWRYSIYVLGGVAMPFEEGHKRFLKELCRVYYGEDGDIDRLGEKERAVAFRESVRTHGSLYEFISAVLSKDPPFAADELADSKSQVNRFIAEIKSANDEVLKSKFDLEWVIGFAPEAEYMTRKLRLVLKPESLGGLNHQYLKFERVQLWGISHPELVRRIVVGVRFLRDEAVVEEPDFENPIIEYLATGNELVGFVAWYTKRHSRKIDVPLVCFNVVEIVVRDDGGNKYIVERFKVEEWLQVFRVPEGYNEWTSLHSSQRDSALICPADFLIYDEGVPATVYKKRFWGKGRGVSDVYLWQPIVDKVCFRDSSDREITLYNRQGYDQIVIVPHNDIVCYQDGLVAYFEEIDGELEESFLPLVFCKADIIVRHFETKNDLLENPNGGEFEYEKIEFLCGGRYFEWTDDCSPQQGKVTLRITVKGVQRRLVVYFLPKVICRDCDNGEIRCDNGEIRCDNGEIRCDDEVLERFNLEQNGTPTEPVFQKVFGTDEEFVSLEIWRATKHKEIIRNGKVVKYIEGGETVEISYILKDDLVIHDFDVMGYRKYQCSQMGSIYSLQDFSPNARNNLVAYETHSKVQVAKSLDSLAPTWLWVNLASKFEKSDDVKLLYWNLLPDMMPYEVKDDSQCGMDDVVFHSLAGYGGVQVLACKVSRLYPFSRNGGKIRANLVQCFEMATEHKVYFFYMIPFRMPNVEDYLLTDLYEPLLVKRGNQLTVEDVNGLCRLAEELGFNWQKKYGIVFYNN